jgi:hypothetical protein
MAGYSRHATPGSPPTVTPLHLSASLSDPASPPPSCGASLPPHTRGTHTCASLAQLAHALRQVHAWHVLHALRMREAGCSLQLTKAACCRGAKKSQDTALGRGSARLPPFCYEQITQPAHAINVVEVHLRSTRDASNCNAEKRCRWLTFAVWNSGECSMYLSCRTENA